MTSGWHVVIEERELHAGHGFGRPMDVGERRRSEVAVLRFEQLEEFDELTDPLVEVRDRFEIVAGRAR